MNLQNFIYALANILNEMSPYILLGFLIAGLLHVFVSPEAMSRHLSGRGWKPVFKAALFGIPLPLCSCGVLPTAVALRRQGASRGAATSFLIATPQTGVDSITATYALLGLPFALLRPVAALAGAFAGGMAVDRLPDSAQPENPVTVTHKTPSESSSPKPTIISRLTEAIRYGMVDMVGSVGKWLVIGPCHNHSGRARHPFPFPQRIPATRHACNGGVSRADVHLCNRLNPDCVVADAKRSDPGSGVRASYGRPGGKLRFCHGATQIPWNASNSRIYRLGNNHRNRIRVADRLLPSKRMVPPVGRHRYNAKLPSGPGCFPHHMQCDFSNIAGVCLPTELQGCPRLPQMPHLSHMPSYRYQLRNNSTTYQIYDNYL